MKGAAYPPEVRRDKEASPATDIYMATGLMTRVVGDRMPKAMKRFAAGCLFDAPRMRPQDAWALLEEFDELLHQLYGPRTFRHFGSRKGTDMGSGRWSTDVYTAAANYRTGSGASAFPYSDSGARKAHAALDPKGVGKPESRDNDEHPFSTPIAVLFAMRSRSRAGWTVSR